MPQAQLKQIKTHIQQLESELERRRKESRPLPASIIRAYESAVESQYALLKFIPPQ